MKAFLDEDFLLDSTAAQRLYHDYAAAMPIIDYHNHLPPQEIAADKMFRSITEIWLKGDHYKWRAMRANGIDERYITGDATDESKFTQWAATVPYTMRNPLYHWTHLELQRYFDYNALLHKDNAKEVFGLTSDLLSTPQYSTQQLLQKMNVTVICTTDDPTDDLQYHRQLRTAQPKFRMLPGFRPDKYILIEDLHFNDSIQRLEAVSGQSISQFIDLIAALQDRIAYFHELGGRIADHGLNQIYATDFTDQEVDAIFQKKLNGKTIYPGEAIVFQSAMLHYLARMYYAKGWVMQFHLGALRNNNDRLNQQLGADVGCDSIGDFDQAVGLSRFLNKLDQEDKLCKTILYNLNPRDNQLFATMAGNFNDGRTIGKIQWGSAWWFLDQKDGMEAQLNVLSNMGLLSRFVGMLTDSRSFLSFPRHEYFRRILCNLIGNDIERGLLPNDLPWLGQMVQDISYNNAVRYFNF